MGDGRKAIPGTSDATCTCRIEQHGNAFTNYAAKVSTGCKVHDPALAAEATRPVQPPGDRARAWDWIREQQRILGIVPSRIDIVVNALDDLLNAVRIDERERCRERATPTTWKPVVVPDPVSEPEIAWARVTLTDGRKGTLLRAARDEALVHVDGAAYDDSDGEWFAADKVAMLEPLPSSGDPKKEGA